LPLETSAPSLAELLADELELRDLLLDACIVDDRYFVWSRLRGGVGERIETMPGDWPPGAALDELRIVERRIHQLKELLHG
jgi:hypothetical protein